MIGAISNASDVSTSASSIGPSASEEKGNGGTYAVEDMLWVQSLEQTYSMDWVLACEDAYPQDGFEVDADGCAECEEDCCCCLAMLLSLALKKIVSAMISARAAKCALLKKFCQCCQKLCQCLQQMCRVCLLSQGSLILQRILKCLRNR